MHARAMGRPPFSFWAKLVAVGGLAVAADQLFYGQRAGATVGVFLLLWAALAFGLSPALRRDRRALAGAAAAGLYATTLVDRPSMVGFGLFGIALTTAVLLPRTARVGDAMAWARRLSSHGVLSAFEPFRDAARLRRASLGRKPPSWRVLVGGAILPIGGGAVFLALFAAANPLIESALSGLHLPRLDLFRGVFWIVVAVAVWATLRPARRHWVKGRRVGPPFAVNLDAVRVSTPSIVAALVVFNALFALENGLDLAFLWSGAGLPRGVTLADYAHRGAYPLVATALLAGAFSLLFLRDGSDSAARPLVRRLVGLWVAQNLLLVASSLLRTLAYVDAYSLTRFRITALVWMGLVALGLALIGWRMLRGKSGVWLVNANALALTAVLSVASVVDLGEVAAAWNVSHARDAGGRGAELDLCYLHWLGPSALRPLLALEQRPISPELRDRAAWVRGDIGRKLEERQADWHGWTWRGARRLEALRSIPRTIIPGKLVVDRNCDGRLIPLPAKAVQPTVSTPTAPRPLTSGARP